MTPPGSGLTTTTQPRLAVKVTATFRSNGRCPSRNSSMHILITTDTVGGVWTYTRELVTGLLQRGVRVTLVSFGNIPCSGQLLWMERLPPACAADLDFRPTGFKLEWMLDAKDELEASAEFLRSVVQETKPDILHSNQFY